MICLDVLKDGKRNAVAVSFDDGSFDEEVVGIFNRYGIKGTFNLITGGIGTGEYARLRQLYQGHELACHGTYHKSLDVLPPANLNLEIFQHRKVMEEIAGYPVCGLAYANGRYNQEVIDALRASGIVYARTAMCTGSYQFPEDFMRWNPTCHINAKDNGAHQAAAFLRAMEGYFSGPRLFFAYSHGHEFQGHFDALEEFCSLIGGNEDIWYAGNMELYDYITAQRSLRISADNRMVYNPTVTKVWFSCGERVYSVGPGETVRL